MFVTGETKHNASIAKRRIVKKTLKNNCDSIFQRFQQSDTYRESQQAIGWDEHTCRLLDKIASVDHSYIATWYERQRYENNWKLAFIKQGRAGLLKARSEYSDAVRTSDLRTKR